MTPAYLKYVRQQSGLPIAAFARALGYSGKHVNVRKQIMAMEAGKRAIREERAAAAYEIEALVMAATRNFDNVNFDGPVGVQFLAAVRRLLFTGELTGSIRSATITPAGRARIGQ